MGLVTNANYFQRSNGALETFSSLAVRVSGEYTSASITYCNDRKTLSVMNTPNYVLYTKKRKRALDEREGYSGAGALTFRPIASNLIV